MICLFNILEHLLDGRKPFVNPDQLSMHGLVADTAALETLPDDEGQPEGKSENDDYWYRKDYDVPEIEAGE
ncbi:MAG TPA: hypothetical protein VIP48_15630 [Streptosporangiaceae bacterium]